MVFPTKKIKVGISLKSINSDSQKIIDTTLSLFKDELKVLNLLDKFQIFLIGTDVFNTNNDVEKYTDKWDANLVIHGLVFSGKVDSKFVHEIKNPHFTYRIYNIPQNQIFRDLVNKDVQLMLSHREWIIDESNDLIDYKKVSQNLVEILLSILSISLCRSYNHPDISIQLIKKVIPYLESHIPKDKRNIVINAKKDKIQIPLNLLKSGRLRTILSSCYINTSRIFILQKKFDKARKTLLEGLENGSDKYVCYSSLAYVSYYLDNLEKSEFYNEKMNDIKKNTLLYLVNKAFFSIVHKQYNDAVTFYEMARNKVKSKNKQTAQDVINFLKERHKEQPKELAYRYAIGLLLYNNFDKRRGKKILLKFYKKADSRIYLSMIEKIKYILKIRD